MTQRILLGLLSLIFCLSAPAHDNGAWKSMKGDISLFVANDTGRNGYYDQKPIAALMGEMADEIGPEAVLAVGDIHHFDGVGSVSDPLWMTNYELIYSHPELMIPWLPVCGNHEYRGNTQAVIDYSTVSRHWEMPARYYSRTFTDKDGISVKVVFIDTTPLIDKYRRESDEYPDAVHQDIDAQLTWLDRELSESDADWTIVAGHHPIYADTSKSSEERTDLQKRVDPILRKHNVDMYVCGHIHNFQHIRPAGSSTDYIVNSAGALSRPKVNDVEGTVFKSGVTGFSVISATKDSLRLHMIDKDGNILHTVDRRKAL